MPSVFPPKGRGARLSACPECACAAARGAGSAHHRPFLPCRSGSANPPASSLPALPPRVSRSGGSPESPNALLPPSRPGCASCSGPFSCQTGSSPPRCAALWCSCGPASRAGPWINILTISWAFKWPEVGKIPVGGTMQLLGSVFQGCQPSPSCSVSRWAALPSTCKLPLPGWVRTGIVVISG